MPEQQGDKKTILLVEDEALIAVMEKQTLKNHGFNAIVAHSGEKAIEIVRTTPDIDLILMDINLGQGRMDGTEAAQIILKEKEIPVLFLSSYTQAEVVQKTEKITSYGYVVKDSGETVLIASINMAFKLHKAYMKVLEREKSLQASEEKYRRIFETTSEGICIHDENFMITLVNPQFARMLKREPDALIGSTFRRFTFDEDLPDMDERRKSRRQGIAGQFERRFRLNDGSTFWTHVSITPIMDDDGRFIGGFSMFTDITDRKQAEGELRTHQIELEMQNEELRHTQLELEASRARYFDLYDLAPVGYFTISEQGLILEANLAAAALLGVAARSNLAKQPLSRFILPEDQDLYYYRFRKHLFETNLPQTCELRMVRGDDTPFPARLWAASAQVLGDTPSLCLVTVIDLTVQAAKPDTLS